MNANGDTLLQDALEEEEEHTGLDIENLNLLGNLFKANEEQEKGAVKELINYSQCMLSIRVMQQLC